MLSWEQATTLLVEFITKFKNNKELEEFQELQEKRILKPHIYRGRIRYYENFIKYFTVSVKLSVNFNISDQFLEKLMRLIYSFQILSRTYNVTIDLLINSDIFNEDVFVRLSKDFNFLVDLLISLSSKGPGYFKKKRRDEIIKYLNINRDLSRLIVKYDYYAHNIMENIPALSYKTIDFLLTEDQRIVGITGYNTDFEYTEDTFQVITIWNFQEEIFESRNFQDVTCLPLLHEDLLFIGFFDGHIEVWNIITSKLIYSLIGHTNSVNVIKYLDKNRIISGSSDESFIIWNGEELEKKIVTPILIHEIIVSSNDLISIFSRNSHMAIYDITTGELKIDTWDNSVIVKGSSNIDFFIGKIDGSLDIFKNAKLSSINTQLGEPIREIKFISNNRLAVTTENKIGILNLENSKDVLIITDNDPIYHTEILPGNQIAAGLSQVKIWDIDTGELQSTSDKFDDEINEIKYLSNIDSILVLTRLSAIFLN